MCEDERGDSSESRVTHLGPEDKPTKTASCDEVLILSLWTLPSTWKKECNKFGNYHVEIIDPCALFSEIQARLKNVLFQDNNAYFGKVDYMDYGDSISNSKDLKKVLEKAKKPQFFCETVCLDTTSPLEEGSLGINFIDCNFKKDIKFQDEEESRMVFFIKLESIQSLLNKDKDMQVELLKKEIEYECTNISSTTITKVTHYLDYDTWNVDRYSHGKKYHWIEVILSNLPTKFFKLLD